MNNGIRFPYDQKEIYEKEIVFFAKCNVIHYQNVTEPNIYPNAYEMYVKKSELDAANDLVELYKTMLKKQFKRFWLFASPCYYPGGGMEDFRSSFDVPGQAQIFYDLWLETSGNSEEYCQAHIYDSETRTVVLQKYQEHPWEVPTCPEDDFSGLCK